VRGIEAAALESLGVAVGRPPAAPAIEATVDAPRRRLGDHPAIVVPSAGGAAGALSALVPGFARRAP
ncbi:MAG: hypothetical protein ABI376_00075, partial [Caulobacteraceae bacterium]